MGINEIDTVKCFAPTEFAPPNSLYAFQFEFAFFTPPISLNTFYFEFAFTFNGLKNEK